MLGRTLMVQGTGSHVGKSFLVAGLCRAFRQDGLRVAPFKAQNMSNNAAVCPGGGEIARAQAVQARACGIPPSVDMNPILLKPGSETGAQVVVRGQAVGTMTARQYLAEAPRLLQVVRESLDRLRAEYDLVILEGAGSPAEVNLRDSDLGNMRAAALADAPVLLVADIDRGGVFAQLLGTLRLLRPDERKRVRGFVINKFRGDLEILRPGLDFLVRRTGRPVLGVVPFAGDVRLPEEDTLGPRSEVGRRADRVLRIDVVRHPHIANFTDMDALEAEPDVLLRYVDRPDGSLPDALILPGSKTTIPDLVHLKACGLADHIARCVEEGVTVVGICGGFQMLGTRVLDPYRVESGTPAEEGLGYLPAITVMDWRKHTALVRAVHLESGLEVEGYEIHMGCTQHAGDAAPVFRIVERHGMPAEGLEGLAAAGGRVWGTYLHGVFDSGPFRRAFLNRLRAHRGWPPLPPAGEPSVDATLDRIADLLREHVDMAALARLAGVEGVPRHGRAP